MSPSPRDYKPGDALSRLFKVPISIRRGYEDEITGVTGYNNPLSGIRIDLPSPSYSPAELENVIKHELVHEVFKNRDEPSYLNYFFNFARTPPTGNVLKDFLINNDVINLETPNPKNYWNFQNWERGGNALEEIPAYLVAYEPQKIRGAVSPATREQYIKDLLNFLNESPGGKLKTTLLENIMKGQAAYTGTGLFPKSQNSFDYPTR